MIKKRKKLRSVLLTILRLLSMVTTDAKVLREIEGCKLDRLQKNFKCQGSSVLENNFSSDLIPDVHLQTFILINTNIGVIKNGTFNEKMIMEIKVNENKKLSKIEENAFNGVIGLKRLVLSDNFIHLSAETLFHPFKALDSLQILSLRKITYNFVKVKTSIVSKGTYCQCCSSWI